MASTITSYSQEYIEDLLRTFLEKFRSDRRTLSPKLKEAMIPKGTYSRLINYDPAEYSIAKKTVETLRAYLEGRPPKWSLPDPKKEFYCYCCEGIYPITKRRKYDIWTCNTCKDTFNRNSRKRNFENYMRWKKGYYQRRFGHPSPERDKFLEKRKEIYLTKTYGEFAPCMKLANQITLEIKNAKRSSRTTGNQSVKTRQA